MYLEPLLFASAVSAVAATISQNSRAARFGLSFYALFSSLVIYGVAEATSALVYLISLGIALAAVVAYVEVKMEEHPSNRRLKNRSRIMFTFCTVMAFLASYLVLQQLIFAIPITIACMGAFTIQKKNLLKTMIGVATIESAFLVILAGIGWFRVATSIPLCVFMLVSSISFPYALNYRGNQLQSKKSN